MWSIDRRSAIPLYRQIADQLAARIRDGELRPGDRLPPTRQLAESLNVGRATAVGAYQLLESEGWIRSTVGRGTEVVAQRPEPTHPADLDRIDLSRLAPDPALFPVDALRQALDQVLVDSGTELLQYNDPRGLPELRATIAERLGRLGLRRRPDEILIVSGAQQGLDLVLRAFASPGERVAIEAPTYSGLLPLVRLARVQVEAIPMTAEGVDLERLEAAAAGLRLFVTMPTFHNPTGITTDLVHRQRLVDLARRHHWLIVEDAVEDELRFDDELPPPLAALDDGSVLYLGTFSKGLVPGLRLGWVAGDATLVDRLASLKAAVDYGTPALLQAAVDRLCRDGSWDEHLATLHREARSRWRALEAILPRVLPKGSRLTSPRGGWLGWLELPPGVVAREVADRTAGLGVLVSPAELFAPDGSEPPEALRLSLSLASPCELERALAVVGHVIDELARHPERPRPRAADAVPVL